MARPGAQGLCALTVVTLEACRIEVASRMVRLWAAAIGIPGDDPPRHRHAQRRSHAGPRPAKRQVATAVLDHLFDHHCTLFGAARHRSPSFRMPIEMPKRTPADV